MKKDLSLIKKQTRMLFDELSEYMSSRNFNAASAAYNELRGYLVGIYYTDAITKNAYFLYSKLARAIYYKKEV